MRRRDVLLSAVLLVAGCASSQSDVPKYSPVKDANLIQKDYAAAEVLLKQVPWLKTYHQPLLTASFADINSLQTSSALGRMISEQISSRFAQEGFTMIEMRLRKNVFIQKDSGEFVLSREVRNLSRVQNAAAVIAGTYAVGRRTVYVSARLIRAADNLILASYDYRLPLGPNTRALLGSQ